MLLLDTSPTHPLHLRIYSPSGHFLEKIQTEIPSPRQKPRYHSSQTNRRSSLTACMEMIAPGILVLAAPDLCLLYAKTGEVIFASNNVTTQQISFSSDDGILLCLEESASVSQYKLTADLKLKKIRSLKLPFLRKGHAFISSMRDGRFLVAQEAKRTGILNLTIFSMHEAKNLSHVRSCPNGKLY